MRRRASVLTAFVGLRTYLCDNPKDRRAAEGISKSLPDCVPAIFGMPPLTADNIRDILHLQPHPIEGGYFAETYRSELKVPGNVVGPAYAGERLIGTAIFYLLTPDTFSALHRLPGDELFHFYLGDPVEMLHLHPDGHSELYTWPGHRSGHAASTLRPWPVLARLAAPSGRLLRAARHNHVAGV